MKLTLTQKQLVIIRFAQANDNKITKKQANELLAGQYYYNGEKYVGEIMARLVKSRCLVRIKPGNYEILSTYNDTHRSEFQPENQLKLL